MDGVERNRTGQRQSGFTLIELLVVIVILGILIALAAPQLFGTRDRAYVARAGAEFKTMQTALQLYQQDNGGAYPPDVDRDLPAALEPYLAGEQGSDNWPNAPWPNSVYDYDAFDSGGVETYQISIRFCPISDPDGCNFPSSDWADDFGVDSSVYFCIRGACKAHPHQPADYPGYCLNCKDDE